jgi:hypothetical protein
VSASKRQGNLLALSGVSFAAFFITSLVLGSMLATAPLPLPDAPDANVVRFYEGNRVAALASSSLQALSAVSLYVFAACVTVFVRATTSKNGALTRLTLGGGILAAGFLLLSVLIQCVLALIATGGKLGLVGILRDLSFLAGGPVHVPLLGLFVGAASIATLRAKALPRWISWLGIVVALLSILSLTSLVFFPASVLIPLGRLLAFVWSVAVSIALLCGGRNTAPKPVRGESI